MNLIQRIEEHDPYLVDYLLDWAGLGPAQPWGAATGFAIEVAHGYGLIRSECDTTLTDTGKEIAASLKARGVME